jgi:CubicO group peptidase (beta-lactamase class C family)
VIRDGAMTKLVPLLSALLATGCAAAPMTPPSPPKTMQAVPPGVDDLSVMLDAFRVAGGLPALGAAVWRDGHLVAIGVSGVRKLGDPGLVSLDDAWHLGSDTKAMTATLVGILVDRGQLRLKDTVADLFRGETIDPGWIGVRVEQLLEHRGGAPHIFPPDVFEQMRRDGEAPDARIKAVRAILALPPAQATGTFVYSNAGYVILGAALERIAGIPWEAMMQRELFAPLQMRTCGFGPPGWRGGALAPWGHREESGALVPVEPGAAADNPPALGPAGTVHCSLEDWGKYLAMVVAGARGEKTLVSAETMKRLLTPPPGGDYTAGWIVTRRSWAAGTTLHHGGSNRMWQVVTWLAPAKGLGFAAVTNCAGDSVPKALDDAILPLLHRYAEESSTSPMR